MELAMLLDECLKPEYGITISRWLEPWAKGGVLSKGIAAARSAGRVTFYLVFKSDPREAWGARSMKALASGKLFSDERLTIPLAFHVIGRDMFKVFVGKDSEEQNRVLKGVELVSNPEMASFNEEMTPHEHLGFKVQPIESNAPDAGKCSPFACLDAKELHHGFNVEWIAEKGNVETFFIENASDAKKFDFDLHGFSRRPYDSIVLNHLGFMLGPISRSYIGLLDSLLKGALANMLGVEKVGHDVGNVSPDTAEDNAGGPVEP